MDRQKTKGIIQILMPIIAGLYFWNYGVDLTLLFASLVTGLLFYMISMAGVHRILSHHIVKTGNIVKSFYCFIGCISMSSPPAAWATMHILHHKYCDTELDPHSPKYLGLWRCALFYFHNNIDELIKSLPSRERRKLVVNLKHLRKDPLLTFFDENYLKLNFLYAFILFVINPVFVIYFYVIPVIHGNMGETLSIINHYGYIGGKKSSERNEARDKYFAWPLFFGEHNHAYHHDNPTGDDFLNTLLRKVFR